MAEDDGPNVERMVRDILDYIAGYREERDEHPRSCTVCWRGAVIKDEGGLWWCLTHYTG